MIFKTGTKLKDAYNYDLAIILANKIEGVGEFIKLDGRIETVSNIFNKALYLELIKMNVEKFELKKRVELHAKSLYESISLPYLETLNVLLKILGPENPYETGMFKIYYYVAPISLFVELYGLEHPMESIHAIEEITKRYTSEHSLRVFLLKYPQLIYPKVMEWAKSENFHLRRLASEGIRSRLPWSPAIVEFKKNPSFILEVLEILKKDEIKFVQKSVANNLNDILKDNPEIFHQTITRWKQDNHPSTNWIIFHATRKIRNQKIIK